MDDFVAYIDTDSCYISLENFILKYVSKEKWDNLSQEQKVKFIQRLSKPIENYVNNRSFEETQLRHYNSQVRDFKIVFEQEKIALTGLFSTKKRYATWTLLDDGKWKDSMSITGMEIIRSDSPEIVKPKIKQILEMVLKDQPDSEIRKFITKCKKELKKCRPEEIAENKTINQIKKYLDGTNYTKGTPHQLKGLAHLKLLLKKFDIENDYEVPQEGNKAKIVYVKPNPYRVDSLSFISWPKEFDEKGIQVDYEKMIENNFIKKIRGLLEVIHKQNLLSGSVDSNPFF